ncbi:hypothetical protein ACFX14_014579 [Malus domestica]
MLVAYLIEDACEMAARMQWTTWNCLHMLEKGMKAHGMAVLRGANVAEWLSLMGVHVVAAKESWKCKEMHGKVWNHPI